MTGKDRKQKAGDDLEDMVSDISDVLVPPKLAQRPEETSPPGNRPPILSNQMGDGEEIPSTNWIAENKGLLIVVAVIGGFTLLSMLGDPKKSQNYPTSQSSSSPRSEPSHSSTSYAESAEEKPPPGTDLVLNRTQIRYCLAEKVRIEVLERRVNTNENAEVALFNVAIDDYNSRCAKFRYRGNAVDVAQGEVNARRAELERQALARLQQWRQR